MSDNNNLEEKVGLPTQVEFPTQLTIERQLETIRDNIIVLSTLKNDYAEKKIKYNTSLESLEKDISTKLLYIISDIRNCASRLNISSGTNISLDNASTEILILNRLNTDVKFIQEEVLQLFKLSSNELRDLLKKKN